MTRTTRLGVAATATCAAVVAALASIAAPAGATTAAATSPVVKASLNFATPAAGSRVTTLAIGGGYAASLTATVVGGNGGTAVSAVGNPGYNNAIDFPAYASLAAKPPLAIVAIKNKSAASDPLNVGTENFTWQADFSLDDNTGTDPVDGDNVLQRGLSPQTQWKLSTDKHEAQCFVRTTAKSTAVVTPEIAIPQQTTNVRWYRAVCNRSATGVLSLKLWAYSNSAKAWVSFATSTATKSAAGSLAMAWSIPVSVGGKLTNAGAIALKPSPDQFNGRIDNVILTDG